MQRTFLQSVAAIKKSAAFALVEVLIAISLLSAVIISVSALSVSMMRANSINQNHLIATELAREGIEMTRIMRDNNWMNFSYWLDDIYNNSGSTYTYTIQKADVGDLFIVDAASSTNTQLYKNVDLGNGFVSYDHNSNGEATPFTRTVSVTPVLLNNDQRIQLYDNSLPSDYILKVLVESTVEWQYRGEDKNITLYTELTDWNN